MLVTRLIQVWAGEIPGLYAKGGKGVPAPIATPPPVAPPPEEEATLETAKGDNEMEKKVAQSLGAKSLAIPLGSIGSTILNK